MFMITKKARNKRVEFAADGVVLLIREFTDVEREAYKLALAKISGTPDAGEQFDALRKETASALLVGWEGVADESGQAVPCDDAAKAAFFDDPETRKYWGRAISLYLYPDSTQETVAGDPPASFSPSR